MTAICKTIAIHGSNLSHLLDYGSNADKTSVSKNGLSNALDYASNPLKTLVNLDDGDKELLVTGVLCQPETALLDFGIMREKYLAGKGNERYASFDFFDRPAGTTRMVHKTPVTAIHLIQSFAETDLDCHTIHQIGIDLCERLGVQAVVDTHLNKEHLHNHIIINAYMPNGSSKFSLTADKRMQIRELSDEIQKNYNIDISFSDPRSQLKQSKGHKNYRDWDAKRQNISWKEEMKRDIAAAKSVADTREEFITIMQDLGYTISRQEQTSITWWNKTHTRKIRDKTLGDKFELDSLFHEPDLSAVDSPSEYAIGHGPKEIHKRPKPISISRYDWNGRRRSDLELLIRKAIALIRHMGCRYMTRGSSTHTVAKKLEIMEQALDTVQKMDLADKNALAERLNSVGADLSHTKSELRKLQPKIDYYNKILPMLSSYVEIKHIVDSIEYWPDGKVPELMLHTPSTDSVQKARANLCPMSNEQKRDLYLILRKHPEYTLIGDGFSEISGIDADSIFNFLKGTNPERPSVLRPTIDVTLDRTYRKRNEHLKGIFDKPIQQYQMNEVRNLLEMRGIVTSTDEISKKTQDGINLNFLSQYDVINIRNCYGNNPFSEKPIEPDLALLLTKQLADMGLAINRETKYVLPSEYEQLQNYMNGFTNIIPELLKQSPAISPMDIEKLQSFMNVKGITSSIPLNAMSKSDFNRMYGYVLSQGQTPDCVKSISSNVDRTLEFEDSIQIDGITEKKQFLLLSLRNQTNELLSLGIDPKHVHDLIDEIEIFQTEITSLESDKVRFSTEYKNLVTLNQQLTYAESPSFIYGTLFNEKIHEKPELIEREGKDDPPTEQHRKEIPDLNLDL